MTAVSAALALGAQALCDAGLSQERSGFDLSLDRFAAGADRMDERMVPTSAVVNLEEVSDKQATRLAERLLLFRAVRRSCTRGLKDAGLVMCESTAASNGRSI